MFKLGTLVAVTTLLVKGLQPTVIVMQTATCFKTVVMMFLQTAVNKVKSIISFALHAMGIIIN